MELKVGPEGKAKLELVNGKVVVSGLLDTKGLDVEVKLSLEGIYFCDELAKLIPGDSAIEAFALGALKSAIIAAKV